MAVPIELLANGQLIGAFGPSTHNDHGSHHRSKQPSNVTEKGIEFVESPRITPINSRFIEKEIVINV